MILIMTILIMITINQKKKNKNKNKNNRIVKSVLQDLNILLYLKKNYFNIRKNFLEILE